MNGKGREDEQQQQRRRRRRERRAAKSKVRGAMLPWNGHSSYALSSSNPLASIATPTMPSQTQPPVAGGQTAAGHMVDQQQQQQLQLQQNRSTESLPLAPQSSNPHPPSLLPPPPPPGPIQAAPAPVAAPITLSSTLHFLQTEHRRYARDRNEWEIERAEMRARVALLEGEKRGNEGALRDLTRRCRMLEGALRTERMGDEDPAAPEHGRAVLMHATLMTLLRSKFLMHNPASAHSPSPSGTSSPLLLHPAPSHSPPLGTAPVAVESEIEAIRASEAAVGQPTTASSAAAEKGLAVDSGPSPSPSSIDAAASTTSPTASSLLSASDSSSSIIIPAVALDASASTTQADAPASTSTKALTGITMITNPALSRLVNGQTLATGNASTGAGGGTSIGGGATGMAGSGSGSHYGMGVGGSSASISGMSNSHANSGGISSGAGGGRDPRGKARSRDYLKQCLQEITYLTASSTLNPLSSASFAVPSIPRPRKILIPVPAPVPAPASTHAVPPSSFSSASSTSATTSDASSSSSSNAPYMTVGESSSAGGSKKSHLPSGMYMVKGAKPPPPPPLLSSSSSNALLHTANAFVPAAGNLSSSDSGSAAPNQHGKEREGTPASSSMKSQPLPSAGDAASVFTPLQRDRSPRGRGFGQSDGMDGDEEQPGINELRGESLEDERGPVSLSDSSSQVTSSDLDSAEEKIVPTLSSVESIAALPILVDNEGGRHGVEEDLVRSSAAASSASTSSLSPHLPSPPTSPSPPSTPLMQSISSLLPLQPPRVSSSTATTYTHAGTVSARNGSGDHELDSLVLETTRKEAPNLSVEMRSGLVWEDDNGVISDTIPDSVLAGSTDSAVESDSAPLLERNAETASEVKKDEVAAVPTKHAKSSSGGGSHRSKNSSKRG